MSENPGNEGANPDKCDHVVTVVKRNLSLKSHLISSGICGGVPNQRGQKHSGVRIGWLAVLVLLSLPGFTAAQLVTSNVL